jgi:predicted dehydrogenase
MQIFKTVIIGCGNIAGGYDANSIPGDWPLTHAGAFSGHGGFDIIACCDPDAKRRLAFQQKWDIPLGVSNAEELKVYGLSIDVVIVCSPTAAHVQHLKTVLDWQPKLLFCEKPIAPDADEVQSLIQQYEAANIPFIVNHNRRWDPYICTLKEDFFQLKWGKIHSVAGTYNKGILNNGGHMVDLIHYLLGPLRVVAVGTAVYDFWPDDPSIPALLETCDGIPVTLNIAHALDYAFFEVQFITERGVLRMEAGGMSWSMQTVIDSSDFPGYRTLDRVYTQEGRYRESMSRAVDNIYEKLTGGIDVPSTGATALQAQRICHQIRQYAQTNQT